MYMYMYMYPVVLNKSNMLRFISGIYSYTDCVHVNDSLLNVDNLHVITLLNSYA